MSVTVRTCAHPRPQRVYDSETATVVCTECALVLNDDVFFTGSNAMTDAQQTQPKPEYFTDAVTYCANINLPITYASAIASSAETMTAYLHSVKKQRVARTDALACCLYNTCKKNSCFRTLEEIESATGCDRKKLWKLESLFGETTDPAHYGDLVEKYCYFLSITFEEMCAIRDMAVCNISHLQNKPQAIIGACIYLYMRHVKNEKCVRAIAEIVSCSPSAIFRLTHVIRTHPFLRSNKASQ